MTAAVRLRVHAYQPQTKPKIIRCGNHWSVEWNRRGDWYPQWKCVNSWELALGEALLVVARGLNA